MENIYTRLAARTGGNIYVGVVGPVRTGKSTFINRLHGSAIAKSGDRPGVTRANQWVRLGPFLEILDTPGMLPPRLDDQRGARLLWRSQRILAQYPSRTLQTQLRALWRS